MTELTKSAYARHRHCSPGYITKLGNEGRLVLSAAGLVDVEATDRLVEQTAANRPDVAERHAKQRGTERAQTAQGAKTTQGEGGDIASQPKTPRSAAAQASESDKIGTSLQTSRAFKEKYSALRAKAEYETLIGDLIPREDVDAAMRFIGGAVRAAFDVFPDQTAPLVAPISDLAEIHEIITQSARDAQHGIGEAIKRQLEELAKKKP